MRYRNMQIYENLPQRHTFKCLVYLFSANQTLYFFVCLDVTLLYFLTFDVLCSTALVCMMLLMVWLNKEKKKKNTTFWSLFHLCFTLYNYQNSSKTTNEVHWYDSAKNFMQIWGRFCMWAFIHFQDFVIFKSFTYCTI